MNDVIRLFVGTDPNGHDAESLMVLEHSARKVTTGPLEITWMRMSHDKSSPWYVGPGGWDTSRWATPFSGFRWGIPVVCGYQGKAIYMDSDMIILKDLRDLWNLDVAGYWGAIKNPGRTCVTLWNCEECGKPPFPDVMKKRTSPDCHASMQSLIGSSAHRFRMFDSAWNSLDGEDKPISWSKILHFTSMSHQLHLKYAIPRLKSEGKTHWFDGNVQPHWRPELQVLFDELYNEAIKSGKSVKDYYPSEPFGDYKKQSQKGYRANHGFDPR